MIYIYIYVVVEMNTELRYLIIHWGNHFFFNMVAIVIDMVVVNKFLKK